MLELDTPRSSVCIMINSVYEHSQMLGIMNVNHDNVHAPYHTISEVQMQCMNMTSCSTCAS